MQLIAFLNIKVNSLITVLILSLKVPTLKRIHVSLTIEGQPVNGIGIDHDVLYASCKAYVEAHAKYASEINKKEGNH